MAEPVMTRPLEVTSFHGGKTDNYIGGRPDQFQDADNMVLVKYGSTAKLQTRYGSKIYDSSYYRIPANDRLAAMAESEEQLFQMCGRNVYYIDSGWNTLTGPSGNAAMSTGSASNYFSYAKWNKHLLLVNDALSQPVKIFNNGSWRVRTLGLPSVSTSGITLTPGGGTGTYIYAFLRSDSYTIGSVDFREVSATSLKTISSAADPGSSAMSITGIPVLSNGATDNYNTTQVKVEIYRTNNGGSTFYKVGEVTNGTTTFSDTTSNSSLTNGTVLYTDGGTVDFDQAPPAKYVVVANDIAWYCHVKEGTSTYPNRVRQSIQSAVYAAPESFYTDLEDEITGCAAINVYPIIFCKNKIYRLEGFVDELGRGSTIKREISSTVGCVSHRSIVTTGEGDRAGVYFAGNDGFYYTNGFSVRKLSNEFNSSYRELIDSGYKDRIYGAYDSQQNRVWWAAQRDEASNDNDIIFVCHLDGPDFPFTTLSGGEDNTDNFAPTSLIYYDGHMLRGDRRGYLFQFTSDYLTDPKIDTSTAPSSWAKTTIIYDYRGPAFDFGTTEVRKWVPRIVVNADNVSNLSLRIHSNNDNSGIFNELAEIVYGGSAVWGDSSAVWGDDQARWNYAAVISHWRRMPPPLRCIYKQIRLTNSYTVIDDYTVSGTATSDTATNTVVLDTAGREWDAEAVDYYISFSDDEYLREWQVTARNSSTELTVDDPSGTLTTASSRNWKLKGYKKNDVLNLLSYVIEYAPLTMTQEAYNPSNAA